MAEHNIMEGIKVQKVTLNIGAGKDQSRLDKGLKLLQTISGKKPVGLKKHNSFPISMN